MRPTEPVSTSDELARAVEGVVLRLIKSTTDAVPDEVAGIIVEEATRAGLSEIAILLVDLEQTVLIPLPPVPAELPPQDIDTTLAGRAYQTSQPVTSTPAADGASVLWIPLIDGSERLGVMYLRLDAVSDHLVDRVAVLAGLVAELIVSKTQYGDALVLARRLQPMSLAAELRWSLLPPLTYTSARAGIACVLEPAYDVAGDSFDYAMDGHVLHLAIFDAMGHGLEASRIANLAMGGYRAARRRGIDLPGIYEFIDEAIADQFGDERFVTAQLATLDVTDGKLRWVNAGHPHPLLLRRGRLASELVAEPSLPLGLRGAPEAVAQASLEPGDSLLFFTDGIVEARSPGGERFGQERLVDLTRRALADQQTLAETARRLVRSVRQHRVGTLRDDATLLFVEWRPPQ